MQGNTIDNLGTETGSRVDISEYRVRHGAITAALDATNGDTKQGKSAP